MLGHCFTRFLLLWDVPHSLTYTLEVGEGKNPKMVSAIVFSECNCLLCTLLITNKQAFPLLHGAYAACLCPFFLSYLFVPLLHYFFDLFALTHSYYDLLSVVVLGSIYSVSNSHQGSEDLEMNTRTPCWILLTIPQHLAQLHSHLAGTTAHLSAGF